VSVAGALARIPVGVVVERRKARSQWIDFVWQPVTVLAGVPETAPWTQLSADGEATTFYAGAAEIALYRTETGNYLNNLNAPVPSLWIALRPTGVEPPYEVIAVTADPAEGEALSEPSTDVVEAVPMPPTIREMVAAFVAEHHVERPFFKRQRDRADPEALARRGPMRKDRE